MPSRKSHKKVLDLGILQVGMKKSSSYKSSKVRIPVTRGGFRTSDGREWHMRSSDRERHAVLNKLIKEGKGSGLSLYRGLVARRTLLKNQKIAATNYHKFTEDMKYLKEKYYGTKHWSHKIAHD